MTDLLARTLKPSPETIESALGDETVILHMGSDTYFGLDALGTRIWAMIKDQRPLPEIRDSLAQEFGVDPSVIEVDMTRFLSDLLAHRILVDA
ncbi:PqqD family protein [Rubellimicrobium roseum]|uniref:PqqD family protein n=1 Tax=Rubellimicrobium roseum TaxID=687525 RepID=UPI00159B8A69|nr:PqqD family protein [Rubellimicrobium roseum]